MTEQATLRALRIVVLIEMLILAALIGAVIDRLVVNHKLDALVEKLKVENNLRLNRR